MSKLDAQRAMREARYARNRATDPSRPEAASNGGTPAPAVPQPRPAPARAAKADPSPAAPQAERCGHRSMNGRVCTREAAHAEKSHRYS